MTKKGRLWKLHFLLKHFGCMWFWLTEEATSSPQPQKVAHSRGKWPITLFWVSSGRGFAQTSRGKVNFRTGSEDSGYDNECRCSSRVQRLVICGTTISVKAARTENMELDHGKELLRNAENERCESLSYNQVQGSPRMLIIYEGNHRVSINFGTLWPLKLPIERKTYHQDDDTCQLTCASRSKASNQ